MNDNGDSNPFPPGSIGWWLWVHRHAVEASDVAREVATQAQIILTSPSALAALAQGDAESWDLSEWFDPMLQAWLEGIRLGQEFQDQVAHALSQNPPPAR
jgi:hypothetical protein